jgi:hypothetical protein
MSRSKIYHYLDNQSDYTNVIEHFNNPTPDTVYNSISGMAPEPVFAPASESVFAPVFAPISESVSAPVSATVFAPVSAPVFAPVFAPVSAPIPPQIPREWYLNKLILKGKNSEKYWTVEINEFGNLIITPFEYDNKKIKLSRRW